MLLILEVILACVVCAFVLLLVTLVLCARKLSTIELVFVVYYAAIVATRSLRSSKMLEVL